MKIKSAKLACLAVFAAALTALPAVSQTTATPGTNAPATTAPAHARRGLPAHGKITALDTNAMTFAIGNQTFAVSSQTRINKQNKPAVLSDLTVGDNVHVFYHKDDAGKATAASVRVVPAKPEPKPEAKPEATPAKPAAQP
jgi:hypothetical protein